MAKVLSFSREFPHYHPRAGQSTYFVESVLKGLHIPINEKYRQFLIKENSDRFSLKQINSFFDSLYLDFETTRTKIHTIRRTSRFKEGEPASLRVWSGRPYRTAQMIFACSTINQIIPVELGFGLDAIKFNGGEWLFDHYDDTINKLAENDGLGHRNFLEWFNSNENKYMPSFEGKILVFSKNPVQYP